MTLTLVAGKTYLNGFNEKVKITLINEGYYRETAFIAHSKLAVFTLSGKADYRPSKHDLVAEFKEETIMIDMTKRYVTRDKHSVRVLAVDLANGSFPVVAAVLTGLEEQILRYNAYGKQQAGAESAMDLIEYKPEEDYVLDQKIWVGDNETTSLWVPRHFAKLANGRIFTWTEGMTSWSIGDRDPSKCCHTAWKYSKPAEPK